MRGRYLLDSFAVAASTYLARAILIARGLVAAAALGPLGYGSWNALSLILDYGYYASLGSLQGLDRELPAHVERGDRSGARRLMAGAWAVTLAGGALYAALVLLDLWLGGRALAPWADGRLPVLALLAALLHLGIHYASSSLRAFGRFRALSAGAAIQALVGGGLGLALVWRQGVFGMLWGWCLGSGLALLWLWRASPEAPWRAGAPGAGIALVRAGIPVFLFFALTTALRSIDRIAIVRWGGEEPLGLYGLGLMAASMVLYLPESVGYVLYPRVAAAHGGAGDAARVRVECEGAQRALNAYLPLAAGLGIVWSGPAVAALLPDFVGGLPALRVLVLGAAIYGSSTVPSYYLLATVKFRTLLARGAAVTLVTAALVAGVASRRPEPLPVAWAAVVGYALFAIAMVHAAAAAWHPGAAGRALVRALLPSLWIAALWLPLARVGDDTSWGAALLRSAALVLGYAPVALALARGVGLGRLAREIARRRGAA